jgi:hypothetical protein
LALGSVDAFFRKGDMTPQTDPEVLAVLQTDQFGFFRKHALTRARQMDRSFRCVTPAGVQEGLPGDYLVLDANGDPYPCANAVFQTTYAPVI